MEALSHSAYLLQQLQEQRIQGLLCDCTLVVKGVCFKAHKNVLAAFSSYFRSLFQNAPSPRSDVFPLVIRDVGGIGQLLDYMYTSRLDLTAENVHSLLDMAVSLQVSNVQNMCQAFLKPCPPPPAPHPEHDCLLANDVDMAEPSKSVEPEQSRPEKQMLHGYKLRNFYSRQYFKQLQDNASEAAINTEPAPNPTHPDPTHPDPTHPDPTHPDPTRPQPPHPLPSLPHPSAPESQYFRQFNTTIEPILTASGPVPSVSHTLPVTPAPHPLPHTPVPLHPTAQPLLTPSDDLASSPDLSAAVRPKKAVYLKKYNYLRSQKALEEMSAAAAVVCRSLSQEPSVQQPAAPPPADTEEPQEAAMEPHSPGNQTLDSEPPEEPQPAAATPAGPRQYCCSDCGKVFKHPSNLELHKRSHTGEKPFQCNVCGRHFSQAGNLQTHLRRHSGEKPYICELCGKGFTASGDVQRHRVVHSGEKPHLCDICGRGFNNLSNLKEHKRTHSTEQSFTCDTCGKSFNTPRKLLKHRARHNGERPHCCSTCGKSFVGSGDLQRHVRSHTGERPYVCGECGRSFSRSALLRRHRDLHCRGSLPPIMPQATVDLPPNVPQDNCRPDSKRVQDLPPDLPHLPIHNPQTHSALPRTLPSTLKPSRPHRLLAQDPHPHASPHSSQPVDSTVAPSGLPCSAPAPPGPDRASARYEEGAPPRPSLQPRSDPNQSPGLLPNVLPPHPPQSQDRASLGLGGSASLVSSVTLWGLAMKTLQNDTD